MKRMTLDIGYALATLAYAAMIFWLGSRPGFGTDRTDFAARLIVNLFHIPLYAGYGFWVLQALSGGTGMAAAAWPRVGGVLTISGIVAVLDEWRQQLTPGRVASPSDILLDLVGVAGILVICAVGAREAPSS